VTRGARQNREGDTRAPLKPRLYHSLYRIRRVEEEIARIYPTDKIKSPVHLSIGQEAASVGVSEARGPDDVVFGTYRCHALYLAKGGDLRRMIAELYGKAPGSTKGKGGSMHLIDAGAGVMGASAVVASTIPHAVGYSLGLRIRGKDGIVACFFGDGAADEGAFHESMNFAALKSLPVLFVCENNFYAIHSHRRRRQAFSAIHELARAYGMPADPVEDGDVFRIHELARSAVEDMRLSKKGPRFIEVSAYRWREHVGPNEDFDAGYRSREEAEDWFRRDPVRLAGEALDEDERPRIEAEVEAEVADAFAFAEAAGFPEGRELLADVY
jgi:TPP-dependent pyruvate/acetoin dehydrogenase alpha subunit